MRKLNPTGSYYFANGEYWSYDTKLTDTYKGYRFINLTKYSVTTSKHQSDLKSRTSYDFILTQCSDGNWDIVKMIRYEIEHNNELITDELQKRTTKANKELKAAKIKRLEEENKKLIALIEKEDEKEDETPIDEEFKALWEQLTDKNKEHIRNGLGDNLLTNIEQAKLVIGVMKSMLLFQRVGL